jgi:hypothetical protein
MFPSGHIDAKGGAAENEMRALEYTVVAPNSAQRPYSRNQYVVHFFNKPGRFYQITLPS